MEAMLALAVAMIIDLPSIISVIGGVKARKLWQVILVAFLAAAFGEVLVAVTHVAYHGPEFFHLRLVAQIIVASIAFFITETIRERRGISMQEDQLSREPVVTGEASKEISAQQSKPKFVDLFFSDITRLMSFSLKWSERSNLEKAYTAIVAIMLVGLLPLPYDFYSFLRLVACISLYAYFMTILPHRNEYRGWFILIIALFILYNPVLPIHIGDKLIWTLINGGVVYALFRARQIFEGKRAIEVAVEPQSAEETQEA